MKILLNSILHNVTPAQRGGGLRKRSVEYAKKSPPSLSVWSGLFAAALVVCTLLTAGCDDVGLPEGTTESGTVEVLPIQGEQGIQGEKGDKGDQGEQGIQGEKGDKGDQGIQGEQGLQGVKGDKGDKGEKGDTGATGRIGFLVGDASSLLNAARVPNAYILLVSNITLEGAVIEASVRALSFVLDLNGYELSGSLRLSAVEGRTLEAFVTNGTFSATATGSGEVSLTTDEGTVDLTGNRQHWKTYAAGASGVTVTDEAGNTAQTLTVADGTLAFIGNSVTVKVNGNSVGVNPQTLTLRAGDTVTANGGTCVFRVTTVHRFAEDGSDVFYGLNWVCAGDSLMSVQGNANYGNYQQAVKAWEMLSGQYAAGRENYNALAVTNNMKRPYLYTGINCYDGKNTSGIWLAQGETGYWKTTPIYLRLQDIPHDADIVTIYGSVNDWTFLSNYDVGTLITDTDQTYRYGAFTYAQHIMEKDGYDTGAITTYAQYISRAIHLVHEQAPLAKVVVISPTY